MEEDASPEKILLFDNRLLQERPSLSSSDDIQPPNFVSFVLYYEDPGYNQEADPKTQKMENLRKRFVVGMKLETLWVQEERVGKHKFLKVSCPTERLYQEAETIRVELPVYGITPMSCARKEEKMFERKMKKLLNEISRETQLSAPFLKECANLFKKGESSNILWSSIKCYLVYNILININISRNKENGEMPAKIGLPYLLMIGAFKDGFALHDPSAVEPVSMDEMQKYIRDYASYVDLRKNLSKKWGGGLCSKQPIHEIRDYFGEKIAFYFAWVSTFMASLWIPALLGLIVFIFGLTNRLTNNTDRGVPYIIEAIKSSSDNTLTPGFAAIMCLWGIP